MASSVPASLKSAGIVPFATRAAQIAKTKPAVAYWCKYWIVRQIVTRGLHNADDESRAYTASLMDQLEQDKTEHASEDAITDDVAAKAYLEQFGMEVFNRADKAIRTNKATRQTADTFQAASTFLELLQVWPPLDPEIAARIKFAKYHALRIAKAVKAGEDPNLSNPSPDPTPAEEAAPLDPLDPEVQALGGLGTATAGWRPAVEDVPDVEHTKSPSLGQTPILDRPQHPSRVSSAAPTGLSPSTAPGPSPMPDTGAEHYYQQQNGGDVSPLESSHERAGSEGGGYFPRTPGTTDQTNPPTTNAQPPIFIPQASAHVSAPISPIQPSTTDTFPPGGPQYPPQPPAAAPSLPPQPPVQSPSAPPPHLVSSPYTQAPPPQQWQPSAPLQPPAVQSLAPPPTQQASHVVDDEAIVRAQKHARWAISALNFEDIGTAVSELQGALRALGAG